MSEESKRRRLRAEARSYGMPLKRGVNADALDRQIQSRVAQDMARGICTGCKKSLHGGRC